jgi:hypothetical protein
MHRRALVHLAQEVDHLVAAERQLGDLVEREPARAERVLVGHALRLRVVRRVRQEEHAQARAAVGARRVLDAQHAVELHVDARLLEGLAPRGLGERLALLEATRGEVPARAVLALVDQQKTPAEPHHDDGEAPGEDGIARHDGSRGYHEGGVASAPPSTQGDGMAEEGRASLRVAAAVAAAKLVLHLATLRPYGYFRDELYYLACADHLGFGYVDHPPLSIVVLAAWRALFGDRVEVLHVVPALAGSATVFVTGRLAAALGGGPLAVALACLAVLTMPARIGFDAYYSMNSLDALFWAVGALLFARAANKERSWLALGAVLGLGLLNKWSIAWLGAGIAVALVATPRRAALRTRGPWLAAALALALVLPNLVWQALHDWPTLAFMKNALAHKYVRMPPHVFFRELALQSNPVAAPLWLAGTIAPFAWRRMKDARPIAIVFAVTLAIVAGTRGKPEYLLGPLALPMALGAVALERALHGRTRTIVAGALVGLELVFAALVLPFALPILPVERFIAYSTWLGIKPASSEKKQMGPLPQFYADMHGWPELVAAAQKARDGLPPAERERAAIWAVTGGYGPAAAIDVLGRRDGLPGAISSHNSYWLWGPGEPTDVMILLGGPREKLELLFESVEEVDRVHCYPCMPYEDDKPVFIARGLRRPLAEVWPELKRYE